MPKTKRISAGDYTRSEGKNSVRISYEDCWGGWVAVAKWDRLLYTDPLPTKRDAIRNADRMLFNACS